MKAVKFATQIDESVLKDLKSFANDSDTTISHVVNEALAEYLGKYKVKPAFKEAMQDVFLRYDDLLKRLAK